MKKKIPYLIPEVGSREHKTLPYFRPKRTVKTYMPNHRSKRYRKLQLW